MKLARHKQETVSGFSEDGAKVALEWSGTYHENDNYLWILALMMCALRGKREWATV